MAWVYSAWVAGAWSRESGTGNRMRLWAQTAYEIINDASASVWVELQLEVRYTATDSTNALTIQWPGSTETVPNIPLSFGSAGLSKRIYTTQWTISRVYGAAATGSFTATMSGVNAVGGPASVTASWSVPARPYSAPAAPTSLTATRVSDTHQSLAFSSTSTTGAPRTSFTLQRAAYGGDWVTIASPTSSPYADKTTTANRRYDYRVRANGPGGSSAWYRPNGGVGDVSTTPAQPSSVTAAKNASGDIVVMWAGTWYYPTGYLTFDVEESANGGITWTSRATGLGAATRSWTHASPDPASPHMYRVRARTAGPTLSGPWRNSNTVQLLAPPSAPQVTGPGGVADATGPISLTWAHSPVDSTPQAAYDLRWRVDGGAWVTTGKTTSTSSSRTIPADTWENGSTVEWQVRTWGLHADASPWSATAALTLSATPTVAIATPADGGVWESSALTVEWAYYQQQGSAQSQWRVTLTQGGAQLEQRTGSGTAASVALSTTLLDGGTYTIAVEVRSAAGVWSVPDTATITVEYAKPPAATVTATFDDSLGVMVLTLATPEGTPAAVSALVERRIDGGAWETIATDLDPSATLVDATTTTSGLAEYRAVTVSALPSSMVGPVTAVQAHGCYLYLSTRDGRVARLSLEVRRSRSDSRDHALVEMAAPPGAPGRLVRLDGALVTTKWTISGLLWTQEEVDTLVAIWSAPGVCLLRDPTGLREWVSLSGGTAGDISPSMPLPQDVSLTATRVEAPA